MLTVKNIFLDESQVRIQKIRLQIKNGDCGETQHNYDNDPVFGCGGQHIRVTVTTGNIICHTQPKSIISKNHFASWVRYQLGDCLNLNIEEASSQVTIETSKDYDKFGVQLMQIKKPAVMSVDLVLSWC